MEPMSGESTVDRITALERLEADLVERLVRCIPPVDQHRTDLERVRSELVHARAERG